MKVTKEDIDKAKVELDAAIDAYDDGSDDNWDTYLAAEVKYRELYEEYKRFLK